MRRFTLLLGFVWLSISFAKDADAPLLPRDAAKAMTLPEGFKATLFAGEPDLVQPIAFTFDDRGRVWVVECFSYPKWTKDGSGKDRILILEDTDGDGVHDKRTVFWDQGSNLSGIEVGHGGVWLCSIPNLIFIPFKPGEDKPAGKPEIVLDGWSMDAKHNVFNSLTWGPDGWLYGCNGILSNSKIGRPGTPDANRTIMNCGVWRYHPVDRKFEVVASGTTNPWGLDFDERGELFITNCVIKHIFHVVPGAHYTRMFGQDVTPNTYGLIESIADHIHWGGGDWTSSRGGKGVHSDAGGGHAHSGCMIYLGDNFPKEYRNRAFMCNIHGNRLNQNLLERQGSSYVAKRAPDFLFANDPWFRGLTVKYGPDGGVYVSDWCDTGECHNYEVADQRNGRIFKVVYGKATPFTQNLNSLNDRELVALQNHENEFIVNHARRILHERKIAGKLDERILPALMQILTDKKQPIRDQLRALWCLYLLDGLGERSVNLQTAADDLRAWCIRLMLDRSLPSQGFLKSLAELAKKEKSPSVRLALASSLQRLPVATRWQLAENLVLNSADEKDAYLPLMIWYGIEPLAGVDLDRTVKLFESSTLSVVRQNLARRIVTLPGNLQENLNSLVNLIPGLDTKPKRDLIIGMREGLKGQRRLPMPEKWLLYYSELTGGGANPALEAAMQLTAQFGDPAALEALRRTALNERADAKIRQWAVSALMSVDAPDLGKLLKELFNTPSEEFPQIRGIAIRGFANLKEPEVAELLIKNYSKFSVEEKADAIAALASRKEFAHALLDAIDKNLIPRADLSLFVARQILAFQDQSLESKLTQVWGQIRSTSKERVALTKKYRELLTPDFMKQANVARGRKLYAANCASCHKLFDEGGNIGPELTGSQRTNLDYVLENILDPAAVVAREYQLNEFRLFNGRLVSGIIKQENDKIVTVQTQNEILNLAKEDIESRKTSKTSMMPEGIFDKLKDDEIRDLIRYLQSRDQVSLPND